PPVPVVPPSLVAGALPPVPFAPVPPEPPLVPEVPPPLPPVPPPVPEVLAPLPPVPAPVPLVPFPPVPVPLVPVAPVALLAPAPLPPAPLAGGLLAEHPAARSASTPRAAPGKRRQRRSTRMFTTTSRRSLSLARNVFVRNRRTNVESDFGAELRTEPGP